MYGMVQVCQLRLSQPTAAFHRVSARNLQQHCCMPWVPWGQDRVPLPFPTTAWARSSIPARPIICCVDGDDDRRSHWRSSGSCRILSTCRCSRACCAGHVRLRTSVASRCNLSVPVPCVSVLPVRELCDGVWKLGLVPRASRCAVHDAVQSSPACINCCDSVCSTCEVLSGNAEDSTRWPP